MASPIELWSVKCCELHHGNSDWYAIVYQLRPNGIREAAYSELGATIGRLQRYCAISQSGPHLNNGAATPRPHTFECRLSAIYSPEISHFCGAAEFFRRYLDKR